MSSTHLSPASHPARPWWRLIDWRLVAAVGLPLWAFVFGMMVSWRSDGDGLPPVCPPQPPSVVVAPPVPPDDTIPPPREVVVRHADPVTVPVVVPVLVPAAQPVAADPQEFRLPDTELLPAADGCQTFGTKVRFHKGPAEAIAEAKAAKKMLFVLHISGHFDDPGFT